MQTKQLITQMRSKRNEKFNIVKTNQTNVNNEFKEKYSYLQEKDETRSKLVNEIKEAFHEDIEQRKEISFLKKKDQMENFERGKNFHQLYKQKLVERILEKKERGDRVKH